MLRHHIELAVSITKLMLIFISFCLKSGSLKELTVIQSRFMSAMFTSNCEDSCKTGEQKSEGDDLGR